MDLANDQLACGDWDPCELHSDHAHMIPFPFFMSDNVLFSSAGLYLWMFQSTFMVKPIVELMTSAPFA